MFNVGSHLKCRAALSLSLSLSLRLRPYEYCVRYLKATQRLRVTPLRRALLSKCNGSFIEVRSFKEPSDGGKIALRFDSLIAIDELPL